MRNPLKTSAMTAKDLVITKRPASIEKPVVETDPKNLLKPPKYTPQNIPQAYIKALAHQLKESPQINHHPKLQTEKWTKTQYELLVQIISEELNHTLPLKRRMGMGTSLSYRTLRKIILEDYKITHPADPRTLNTLNKLITFLGYEDWDAFVCATDSPKPNNISPQEAVTNLIQEAVNNQYQAYHQTPQAAAELLTLTHIKDSPSFNLIMEVVTERNAKSLVISNQFNPSTYEILDMEIKKLEPTYAQVYTKEYWLLCWWDTQKNHYVKRYKNISEHFYILQKTPDGWRVKTNASTADPIDMS